MDVMGYDNTKCISLVRGEKGEGMKSQNRGRMRTALVFMLSCIMAVGMLPVEALADERFVAENVVWEGEGDNKKFVQATFGATYTLPNAKGSAVIRSDWLTVHVHSLTKTDAIEATCTEDGNIDYWTDDQDGKLYADEGGTKEITVEETV